MLRELRKYCVTINTRVFPGKMCSDRRKNHGCGQKKKPEGASSARFGVGTAANAVNSSVVPTEFAAEAIACSRLSDSRDGTKIRKGTRK